MDLGHFRGPGPRLGPFRGRGGGVPGPILSLYRPIWGIWDWIRAILGGLGPGFEPFQGVLNRPIWGIWECIWAYFRFLTPFGFLFGGLAGFWAYSGFHELFQGGVVGSIVASESIGTWFCAVPGSHL